MLHEDLSFIAKTQCSGQTNDIPYVFKISKEFFPFPEIHRPLIEVNFLKHKISMLSFGIGTKRYVHGA